MRLAEKIIDLASSEASPSPGKQPNARKKCKIMQRRVSPGADKVNETGEPTLQRIYEPPGTPRGCGESAADVAPGVPTPRLAGAARTLTVKTGALQRGLCMCVIRGPIEFQLISTSRRSGAPLLALRIARREKNSKSFAPSLSRRKETGFFFRTILR